MLKPNFKFFNFLLLIFCWALAQCTATPPATPTEVAVIATTAVPATATLEPTATATATHTAEPTNTPTATATATETLTPSPTATNTSTPRPTAIPATATFTVTPPPPLELTEFETALRGTNQYVVIEKDCTTPNSSKTYNSSGTIEFANSNVMTLTSPDRLGGAGYTYSRLGPNQWLAAWVTENGSRIEISIGIGQNAFSVAHRYWEPNGNEVPRPCKTDWVKQ